MGKLLVSSGPDWDKGKPNSCRLKVSQGVFKGHFLLQVAFKVHSLCALRYPSPLTPHGKITKSILAVHQFYPSDCLRKQLSRIVCAATWLWLTTPCVACKGQQIHKKMQKCRIAVAGQNSPSVESERHSCLGSTDCADELSPEYKEEFSHVPPSFKYVGRKRRFPAEQGRVRHLLQWLFRPCPKLSPHFAHCTHNKAVWIPSPPPVGKVKNLQPQQIQVDGGI